MNTPLATEPSTSSIEPILTVPLATSDVLGVRFHCLRIPEVIQVIERFVIEKTPRLICHANAYTLSLSWKDGTLRNVLDRADLVLPDGMSIVWGGRWIGIKVPERVAGPDLMSELCRTAGQKGYRIFLMGSSQNNLERLRAFLVTQFPSLIIAGIHSPPMSECLSEDETQKILSEIHDAKPDILFVGMSMPKQEKWIATNLDRLDVPVCIAVGAAFDFLSGKIPRAPLCLRNIGLEWLYRLYCEPRRLWKRYLLGNFIFLSHLGAAWVRFRFRSTK